MKPVPFAGSHCCAKCPHTQESRVPSRHCRVQSRRGVTVGSGWNAANSNSDIHPLLVLADRQCFESRVTGGILLPCPSPDHPHLHWDHPCLLWDHIDGVRVQETFPPCGQRGPLLARAPGKQERAWPSPPHCPMRTGGSQQIADQISLSLGPPLTPTSSGCPPWGWRGCACSAKHRFAAGGAPECAGWVTGRGALLLTPSFLCFLSSSWSQALCWWKVKKEITSCW